MRLIRSREQKLKFILKTVLFIVHYNWNVLNSFYFHRYVLSKWGKFGSLLPSNELRACSMFFWTHPDDSDFILFCNPATAQNKV